ncbi:MAG: hypothetical protein AAGI11_02380 [Pseudomonadota bacterium]
MNSINPIRLRLPTQDLKAFEPFALDADSAQRWAQELPITNTQEVIDRLESTLGQLNRVALKPDDRFHILEAIRPSIHVVLVNLQRKLMNLPLVLPKESRAMLRSAGQLYRLSATAYTLVALHAIRHRDEIHSVNPARLVCEALQRAVHFSGRMILQSLQLYEDAQPAAWQNLHQLYALAERQQLSRLPVVDRLSGGGSIAGAYLQAVMLGCCKPNQLLQSDMAAVYRAFLDWSEFVDIEDPEVGDGLFIVDLDGDQPPLYSAMYPSDPGNQCRFITTEALRRHLEELRESSDYDRKNGIVFDRDCTLSDQIVQHLLNTMSEVSSRNFSRLSSDSELSLTLGLSDSHYHLAGELTFDQLLFGSRVLQAEEDPGNPFLPSKDDGDPWATANPDDIRRGEDYHKRATEHRAEVQLSASNRAILEDETGEKLQALESDRHPVYRANAINASPGGYCLRLHGEPAIKIRGGEILALREDGDDNWSIAMVRWLKRFEDNSVMFGVELLSPMAEPYGARILNRRPPSEPLRALLMPEIKLVGQAESLLVPKVGFREGQRVELMRGGDTRNVRLVRQLPLTGNYAQFEINHVADLAGKVKKIEADLDVDSAYESVWSKI